MYDITITLLIVLEGRRAFTCAKKMYASLRRLALRQYRTTFIGRRRAAVGRCSSPV